MPYNPAAKFTSKYSYNTWICFILVTIAPNSVPFWTIYPLKLMYSAISAFCVTTWIGQTPSFGIRITIITRQTVNVTNKNGKMLKLWDRMSSVDMSDEMFYEWREQRNWKQMYVSARKTNAYFTNILKSKSLSWHLMPLHVRIKEDSQGSSI